ncbi:MAG: glycine cleavage system protein H [Pseudomonadota bacterium]|nr:glycine cleavage system protein H [Pseudomonadota bacterium]
MNAPPLHHPAHLHYLIEHQVWARLHEDGTATVGITALGIRLSGEIYMCRPKAVGTVVEQGRAVAVVELAKSIVAVKSPVTGTVQAINPRLADTPELVHLDPYGEGWIARLQLSRWPDDLAQLVHGDAVLPAMRAHARLFREDVGDVVIDAAAAPGRTP